MAIYRILYEGQIRPNNKKAQEIDVQSLVPILKS